MGTVVKCDTLVHHFFVIPITIERSTTTMTPPTHRRNFRLSYSNTILSCMLLILVDAQKFQPYESNGGLVSAVAGKDFCVVACDTRMTDGGYQIYSRRHTQSRMWGVASVVEQDDDGDENNVNNIFRIDGSVQVPIETTSHKQRRLQDAPKIKLASSSHTTLIASAGCNADCEGLKRVVRADVRAAEYFKGPLSVEQVANALSQILYQRRGFPYYVHCVVGGLTSQGEGAAYAYDSLGNYERLAVATSGSGQELLQPILDRQFRTWLRPQKTPPSSNDEGSDKLGVKTRLAPAVIGKQVSCDVDEAVSILINAYRSVSEREIQVGDLLVLCVIEQETDGGTTCRALAVPMKEH